MGPVKVIYANGGFTHSALWVQMLADVFNVEVRLTDTAEGSALGAAILGMHVLGVLDNLEDASQLLTTQKTFTPDPEAHEVYIRSYLLFKSLYPKLEDSFSQLAANKSIDNPKV